MDFFTKHSLKAIYNDLLFNVPASITLAQAALESDYGKSYLSRKANNFFGIKAYSNPDNLPVIYLTDDKANEPFRVYSNPFKSFLDHSKFLKENARYKDCFGLDAYGWAKCLEAKGYATSNTYAETLTGIIYRNNLTKYDVWGKNKFLILLILLALIVGVLYLYNNKKIK